MPLYEVHKEGLHRRYRVSLCSLGALFCLACVATVVIAPLAIAWGSHSFWIRQRFDYEQPTVQFRNEMLVLVEGLDGDGNAFQSAWTTSTAANDLLGASVRPPIVRTSQDDFNRDASLDTLSLSVSMPLLASERVHRVVLLAAVQVLFTDAAKISFDGLVAVDAASPLPGRGVTTDGDLSLRQRYPVKRAGGLTTLYPDTAALPLDAVSSLEDLDVASVLKAYHTRNITTVLASPSTFWSTDAAPASTATTSAAVRRAFTADVTVRVNEVALLVRPFVTEELKQGWIQYLAFLVVVYFLVDRLKGFVFGAGLVSARVSCDATPRRKLHAA